MRLNRMVGLSLFLASWTPGDGVDGKWSKDLPWDTKNPPDTSSNVFIIPVVIPLTEHGCGPSRYMAMRIAADHVNNRDFTIAPAIEDFETAKGDFTIRLEVVNNEKTPVGSLAGINKLIDKIGADKVRIILGPNGSGNVMAAAPYLNVLGLAQFGWAATSSKLSNKDKYPNFFRSAAPDNQRMNCMGLLLLEFGFSRAHVIYTDDDYTSGEKNDLLDSVGKLKADGNDIEVMEKLEIKVSSTGLDAAEVPSMKARLDVIKTSTVRVVVALAMEKASLRIFEEITTKSMLSDGYVWIGTDGMAGNQIVQQSDKAYFTGTLYVQGASKGPNFAKHKANWEALMRSTNTPEFDDVGPCGTTVTCKDLGDKFTNGWTDEKKETTSGCEGYTPLAYDAVLTIAQVIDDIMFEKLYDHPDKITREDMIEGLKGLTADTRDAFQGLSGDLIYNKNQDRANSFIINNWGPSTQTQVCKWDLRSGFVWEKNAEIYWPGVASGVAITAIRMDPPPFPPDVEMGKPQPCAGGEVFDKSIGECKQCLKGSFMPAAAPGEVVTECEECLPGKFTPADGATVCKNCPTGSVSGLGSDSCSPCPIGKKSAAGAQCDNCEPGRANTEIGQISCKNCVPGEYAPENQGEACLACPLGKVSESAESAQCKACNPGTYASSVNMSSCELCPVGRFASGSSASECEDCTASLKNSVTKLMGSTDVGQCICRKGYYLPSATATECLECGEGMQCAIGSSMVEFETAKDDGFASDLSTLAYPVLKPQFWSSKDEPLKVYRCANDRICPGGKNWEALCSVGAEGRVCGKCQEDYAYDGSECVSCSDVETSKFLFPVLPILLSPIAVSGLYYMFRDMPVKWGSWKNGIAALVYLILSHYQMISLITSIPLEIPSSMSQTWQVWSWTQDVISLFRPTCAGVSGFTKYFIMQSLLPVYLLAVCVTAWAGSIVVNNYVVGVRMEVDRMINLFFSVIFAFYIGIASASVSLFKCQDNPKPNDDSTLIGDLSIICGSGEWNDNIIVALACIVVYCIGCGGLYTYIIAVAPAQFKEESFQKRWKFLFIKYNGIVYWWSLPILAKGVILNLGFVIIPSAIGQIYWLMVVTMLYAAGVYTFRPWRHTVANVYDAVTHMSMMCLLSISSLYSDRSNLQNENMGALAVTIACLPLIALMVSIGLLVKEPALAHFYPEEAAKRVDRQVEAAELAFKTIGALSKEEMSKFLTSFDNADRKLLKNAALALDAELNAKFVRRLTTCRNADLGAAAKKRLQTKMEAMKTIITGLSEKEMVLGPENVVCF